MSTVNRVKQFAARHKEFSISDIISELRISAQEASQSLDALQKQGMIAISGRGKWVSLIEQIPDNIDNERASLIPANIIFYDWCNIISRLRHCYEQGLNVLIIGPKGIGKTAAVLKVAEYLQKPVRTINFSLRTREHHFIGRLDALPDGSIYFKEGPLIKCMLDGDIIYMDELSACGDAAVLLRLDEALDFRRELSIEGRTYKAKDGFWAIASINPLDRYHQGLRELPSQIISRFPVRIYLDYPDVSTEYAIVKEHVPRISENSGDFIEILNLIKQIRETDLPYLPSIRESIALARLMVSGVKMAEAIKMILVDIYRAWSIDAAESVKQLIYSRLAISL